MAVMQNPGSVFFKCTQCEIFFATEAAANTHRCHRSSSSQNDAIPDNTDRTLFTCTECQGWFADQKTFDSHPCAEKESADEQQSSASSGTQLLQQEQGNVSNSLWNRPNTLLLIDEYAKYKERLEKGLLRKKEMWQRIRMEMVSKGCTFSADQIAGRWKSIMRAYKNVKDHNGRSGNNLKRYEYQDELDVLFESNPSIVPECTASSGKRASSVLETGEENEDVATSDEQNADVQNAGTSSVKKARNRSSTKEVVSLFKDYLAEQKRKSAEENERREKMHNERISVMKSLVNAITGKSNHPRPASGQHE